MNEFWENAIRFPGFFLSVLLGFFLTLSKPILRLLKFRKTRVKITIALLGIIVFIANILKLMLGLK